jgi:transposase
LKRSRRLWLRNETNLSAEQSTHLGSLAKTNLKTARAHHLRLAFQDIYKERSRHWAGMFLDK